MDAAEYAGLRAEKDAADAATLDVSWDEWSEAGSSLAALQAIRDEFDAEIAAAVTKAATKLDALGLYNRDRITALTHMHVRAPFERALPDSIEAHGDDFLELVDHDERQRLTEIAEQPEPKA